MKAAVYITGEAPKYVDFAEPVAENNDQLLIGVVWDKFAGKVLPGEQVIAINDVDCSHVNFCELINKGLILGNAETAILTIKDKNGKLRKIEINKE